MREVIWLSGHFNPSLAGLHPRLGFVVTPASGYTLPDGVTWAADTGCFKRPDSFSAPAYLDFLERRIPQIGTCLFATAPDRVGDAEATWRHSAPVLPLIRALGYKAALVAQDGLEGMSVDWSAFDCLFIGGTTRWKLSEAAYELAAEAKRRGKWAHMGRVNGGGRLAAAAFSGYDSADGMKLGYGPIKNLPIVLSWLDGLDAQPALRIFA